MNCKPGDLVMYVGTYSPSYGMLATVVEKSSLYPDSWLLDKAIKCHSFSTGDVVEATHMADCSLRPIRDQDGEDETLTWAGKPNEVKETA